MFSCAFHTFHFAIPSWADQVPMSSAAAAAVAAMRWHDTLMLPKNIETVKKVLCGCYAHSIFYHHSVMFSLFISSMQARALIWHIIFFFFSYQTSFVNTELMHSTKHTHTEEARVHETQIVVTEEFFKFKNFVTLMINSISGTSPLEVPFSWWSSDMIISVFFVCLIAALFYAAVK